MIKKIFQKIHLKTVNSYQKDFAGALDIEHVSNWLDLGCHDGKFLKFLSSQKEFGGSLIAVEISDKHIKAARRRNVKVFKSDLNDKLPFKSKSFDLITASHVIEHIERLDVFLGEVARVLKKSGQLVIGTENLSAWYNIFALIFGYYPFSCDICHQKKFGNPFSLSEGEKNSFDYHRTVFNIKALKEFLEFYNFKVLQIIGTGYYPLPIFFGKYMSRIDPAHSVFIIVSAKKG